MRYRVTCRSNEIELRGYIDGLENAQMFSVAVKGLGAFVMVSPAPDDYYPWVVQEHEEMAPDEVEG